MPEIDQLIIGGKLTEQKQVCHFFKAEPLKAEILDHVDHIITPVP